MGHRIGFYREIILRSWATMVSSWGAAQSASQPCLPRPRKVCVRRLNTIFLRLGGGRQQKAAVGGPRRCKESWHLCPISPLRLNFIGGSVVSSMLDSVVRSSGYQKVNRASLTDVKSAQSAPTRQGGQLPVLLCSRTPPCHLAIVPLVVSQTMLVSSRIA